MKVTIVILLAALMLGACGVAENAPTGTAPDQTTQQTQPAGATQGTTGTAQDLKALAESCIDAPVADLFALVGQPESSEYAPSCMNPGVGEDGVLYYDGFVVYTYKEGDTETVDYVE